MNNTSMKPRFRSLLLLAAFMAGIPAVAAAQSSANYAIAFHLIDNSGAPGTATASGHTAHSLIGQAAVHTYAQSNAMLLSSGAGCAFCGSQITVGVDPAILPMMMRLYQNYPNPFNPVTTIRYSLEREATLELAVYNLFGEKVDVIVRERQSPGDYSIDYIATDLASGVYLYRLMSEHGQLSRRFVLLK